MQLGKYRLIYHQIEVALLLFFRGCDDATIQTNRCLHARISRNRQSLQASARLPHHSHTTHIHRLIEHRFLVLHCLFHQIQCLVGKSAFG